MRKWIGMAGASFIAAACCLPSIALAQDNSMTGDKTFSVDTENAVINDQTTEKIVKAGITRENGWYPKLRIGGSASVNYNKDVDGVNDGTAFTFGVYLKGALDAVYKNFEWQSKLEIEHQQTKIPTIDDFIKSADKLDFNTLVLFRIPDAEWVGPFARFRLQTSLFPGRYISDKDVTVRYYKSGMDKGDKLSVSALDPDVNRVIDAEKEKGYYAKDPQKLDAQKSAKMSSAFEPLLLSEAVGVFMAPYEHELLNVNVKVGVAGQHLFADGGYVSFDTDDDDEFYDVRELVDTHSVGIEGELELSGVFVGYVNWSASAAIYYPFAVNDDHGLDDSDMIHADFTAKISVKLSTWGSLDYALIVKRAPFVTTDWQLTNTLLFNVGFDVFK